MSRRGRWPSELSSTLGEVLLFLARTADNTRHARDAIGLLATAADRRAEHRVRSRAFDAIALARAQLFTGQFEAAHATAEHAVAVGTRLDSARVRRRYRYRYRYLAREAAVHPTVPHAREIHELLTTGRP
ncbi:hypothetical protein QMK19_31785 [Streptomyces sp. H10-C2]|uniref:hypothetical protein n=1 Tax=unclassified Streptomyces TaxID=2593676 RepID=UPI0024BBB2B2|nr:MULTISPECIES: hypothetical protein [unclassified Streptomyces]MDJ0346783.1 hypothetical protein [Streptomyces sp. PH10-H1]MDJ0374093.1 hypothetical protein [Streptomyces sp. H10-C2]